MGVPPVIIHFNKYFDWISPHNPSILGDPPFQEIPKKSTILKRQRSHPSPAHLFLAMIGRHKWVMAKLPRLRFAVDAAPALPGEEGIMAARYWGKRTTWSSHG